MQVGTGGVGESEVGSREGYNLMIDEDGWGEAVQGFRHPARGI